MPRTKRAAATSSKQTVGCLLKIQDLYPQMTAKEKVIADYILRNQDVVYHSITEFVARSKAGYGSVIRFCKRLGYTGFQDFKIHLAEDFAVQKATEAPGRRGALEIQAEEAFRSIRQTVEMVSKADFEASARLLAEARTVLVVGSAGSAPTAKDIEYRLTWLGILAVSVDDGRMQEVRASALTEQDVIFLVSFSGTSKEIQTAGEIARGAGAKVLCLTNFATSPVVSLAHHKLVTGIRIDPGREELTSKVATQFLLDALFKQVAKIVEESPVLRARRNLAVAG